MTPTSQKTTPGISANSSGAAAARSTVAAGPPSEPEPESKSKSKPRWTDGEVRLLMDLIAALPEGPVSNVAWKEIAKQIPGRSWSALRQKYRAFKEKATSSVSVAAVPKTLWKADEVQFRQGLIQRKVQERNTWAKVTVEFRALLQPPTAH